MITIIQPNKFWCVSEGLSSPDTVPGDDSPPSPARRARFSEPHPLSSPEGEGRSEQNAIEQLRTLPNPELRLPYVVFHRFDGRDSIGCCSGHAIQWGRGEPDPGTCSRRTRPRPGRRADAVHRDGSSRPMARQRECTSRIRYNDSTHEIGGIGQSILQAGYRAPSFERASLSGVSMKEITQSRDRHALFHETTRSSWITEDPGETHDH